MNAPWNEPFERFKTLFAKATQAQPQDPNAMSLATVDAHGRPTVRVVLLKDVDARGFVFFTNHLSAKGRQLTANPMAGLNFYWPALREQVRVDGRVEAVLASEADAYFATRPRESQLGAWASEQSQPLESRSVLESRLTQLTGTYEGRTIPRPPHWSGFRVLPEVIEFWRAHPHRLHWREQYVKEGEGWQRGLLYP